jgi:putative endonuclease
MLGSSVVTLYVLKGKTGKRYIGITNNLPRRLEEHRKRSSKGGQILHGDFCVLYTESFSNYTAARDKEKFFKSGQGRRWLDAIDAKSKPATD